MLGEKKEREEKEDGKGKKEMVFLHDCVMLVGKIRKRSKDR